MVIKRRLIRRKPVEEEVEDEEVEEVEDTEVEEDEVDVEEEDEDYEEEGEEEEPQPVKKLVSRGIAPRPVAKLPMVQAKPVPKQLKLEKVEEEVAPAKTVKVMKVEETVVASVLMEAMKQLADGKVMIVTNLGNGKFSIGHSDNLPTGATSKLRGNAYYDAVVSPEYEKWSAEWKTKTYEEKVRFAQKKKITWDEYPNPKVDVIRLTEAVRTALGIEKYRPEYRTRASRAALRGG